VLPSYVTHDNTPVKAHVLISKGLPSGEHPLIINWHGGGLIVGSALFTPFFPTWLLPFTQSKSAILISPDYTLLPSPNGLADITADIELLWKWVQESLPTVLAARAPSHKVDLSRVLINGGSAGGYLAASLALSHPKEIRAVALAYPMLDFDSDFYQLGTAAIGAPNVFHAPDSSFPSEEDTRATLAKLRAGPVVAEGGVDRMGAFGAFTRAGMMPELFDPKGTLKNEIDVWPVRRVRAGVKLPPRVWIMHGDQDTAVDVDGSRVFSAEAKKALADSVEVRLDIVSGMDHGFDATPTPAVQEMLQGGTEWLAEVWLKE
jgi:acetyl esterase/lipase